MHSFTLHIIPDDRKIVVPAHAFLHEALDRHGVALTAYCDGTGLCGKCIVEIRLPDGNATPETPADTQHLSDDERAAGLRLACQWRVSSDAVIRIPEKTRVNHLTILTKDAGAEVAAARHVSDAQPYGIAVDIGTTTVVGSLLDCRTGRTVAVSSNLNGQHSYGADVVTRINHSLDDGGLDELHSALLETVNGIIVNILAESGVAANRIAEITLTGNTVMLHTLHKASMATMAQLPFAPSFSEARSFPPEECGIELDSGATAYSFPVVGGFVGGDIVACMLATDMDQAEQCQLIIDIGTNGEVALGCKRGWVTTSAPAGPAFEGSRISSGMRGTLGAIEHVRIIEDGMVVDVIGQQAPLGVCGTGLVDAAATMLDWGVLDYTGRLKSADELPASTPTWLKNRLGDHDGEFAFLLFDPTTDAFIHEGADPRRIFLTQRDFRELQLAKGAVATAYELLLRRENLTYDDICCVFLAGAFGNYLRPAQARRIGLLPNVPLDKIHFIGNAASTGAKMVLVSLDDRGRAERIARDAGHIELAADPDFQMLYAEQMLFPAGDNK